jgi:hypothetical protein
MSMFWISAPTYPSVVFRSCFFSIVHYKALLDYNWTFFLVCHVCWCNLLHCWFVVFVFEKIYVLFAVKNISWKLSGSFIFRVTFWTSFFSSDLYIII